MPPFDDDKDEEKITSSPEARSEEDVSGEFPPMDDEDEDEDADSVGTANTADLILAVLARAPARAPPADQKGTTWGDGGRYRVEERIGRGATGTVYLARDEKLRRKVALKVLDASGNAQEDALRAHAIAEARLGALIAHQRIAHVYDVGEQKGITFVVMEYIRGPRMRDCMRGPRTPEETLDIIIQIAEGLSVLHTRGVVHRDLKPENVMLPPEGVKLVDFGLARHVVSIDTSVEKMPGVHVGGKGGSTIVGTPEYMAPEQYRGENPNARADIFALGIIAFELVAGERPFKGETPLALRAAIERQPVRLDGPEWKRYPPRLSQVVGRMLERDQSKRLADGTEALLALRKLAPRLAIPRWAYFVAALVLVLFLVFFFAFKPAAYAYKRYQVLKHVPPEMAVIKAGTIAVGHTQEELDKECAAIGPRCDLKRMQRELPGGSVDVEPFFLDRLEVTNEQMTAMLNLRNARLVVDPEEDTKLPRYVRFAQSSGPQETLIDLFHGGAGIEYGADHKFHTRPGFELLPVARVSWFGAQLYCGFYGKRLPAEDEWEAAARGKENRAYPWGSGPMHCGGAVLPSEGTILMDPGCPALVVPAPVGTAAQDVTPDGIYDLAGNVAEWTSSVYTPGNRMADPDHVAKPDAPGKVWRVVRGGSWPGTGAVLGRSTGRVGQPADTAGANIGFRCARSLLE
jgi:formylglycine-generating enzyme required for sulfatase activity/predicted Ser/Thr protein kinase